MKSLVTKLVDNVQVSIRNIHIRLENFEHFNSKFSMGFTLREVAVNTTNSQWEKEYFDRTNAINADKPVFKLLSIAKFGVYWRSDEEVFYSSNEDF